MPSPARGVASRAPGAWPLALVLITGCGGGDVVQPPPVPPPVSTATTITVSPPQNRVIAGQTVQLSATPRTSGGAIVSIPITWSSTAPGVATVSQSGLVTAVAAGEAEILASAGAVVGTALMDVVARQQTLTVFASPGILGTPSAGEHVYNTDDDVPYAFSLAPAYHKLVVQLNGLPVPAQGVVRMSSVATLTALADSTVSIPAEDQQSLVLPFREMLTSPTPLTAYLAFEAALDQLYLGLPMEIAAARAHAAIAEAFDPQLHAAGLMNVIREATNYYQQQAAALTDVGGYGSPSFPSATDQPLAFLYSNGIWTPGHAPARTVETFLKPRILAAGFPTHRVRAVLNRSGIDGVPPGANPWLCLMTLGAAGLSGGVATWFNGFGECLKQLGAIAIGGLADLGQAFRQYVFPSATSISSDGLALAAAIRQEYAEGRLIVVIAHSQGNLVTTEALRQLRMETPQVVPQECVGVVSLAPLGRVAGASYLNDMIIRDGFAMDILALLTYDDPLTPSITNALSNARRLSSAVFPINVYNAVVLHSVNDSYLGSTGTKEGVSVAIADAVDKITVSCTSLPNATVSVQSNAPASWSLFPGGLTGSGTSSSYGVRVPPGGTVYTLLASPIADHSLSITSSDGAANTVLVTPGSAKSFTLTYTPSGTAPRIELSPPSLSFSTVAGGSAPPPQSVAISNSGSGVLAGLVISSITYPVGQPIGWLGGLTLSGTTAPTTLTIAPESPSMAVGTYTATLTISATGVVANSPIQLPVTYTVAPAALPCSIPAGDADDILVPTIWRGGPGCQPVRIRRVIDVQAPLVIEAGTEIILTQNGGIHVDATGRIEAGAPGGSPVRFRGEISGRGKWRGIAFGSDSKGNRLTRVEVIGAGTAPVGIGYSPYGAVGVKAGAEVAIAALTVRESSEYGLSVQPDGVVTGMHESAFIDNTQGGLVIPIAVVAELPNDTEYSAGNGVPYVLVRDGGIGTYLGTGSVTWSLFRAPLRFQDAGIFTIDAALNIEAGVRMQFRPGAILHIYGSLSATGTFSDPVVFEAASGLPGGWHGIRVLSNSSANSLSHVHVAQGGGGTYTIGAPDYGNIVLAPGSRLQLMLSVIRDSKEWGIVLEGNATLLPANALTGAGNIFLNNAKGAAKLP